ncbi:MAG: hypothetical protein AAB874_03035, partial [Patescibacteria group bacterium]
EIVVGFNTLPALLQGYLFWISGSLLSAVGIIPYRYAFLVCLGSYIPSTTPFLDCSLGMVIGIDQSPQPPPDEYSGHVS